MAGSVSLTMVSVASWVFSNVQVTSSPASMSRVASGVARWSPKTSASTSPVQRTSVRLQPARAVSLTVLVPSWAAVNVKVWSWSPGPAPSSTRSRSAGRPETGEVEVEEALPSGVAALTMVSVASWVFSNVQVIVLAGLDVEGGVGGLGGAEDVTGLDVAGAEDVGEAPARQGGLVDRLGAELGGREREGLVVVAGTGPVIDEVEVGRQAETGEVEVEGGAALGRGRLDDGQRGVLGVLERAGDRPRRPRCRGWRAGVSVAPKTSPASTSPVQRTSVRLQPARAVSLTVLVPSWAAVNVKVWSWSPGPAPSSTRSRSAGRPETGEVEVEGGAALGRGRLDDGQRGVLGVLERAGDVLAGLDVEGGVGGRSVVAEDVRPRVAGADGRR